MISRRIVMAFALLLPAFSSGGARGDEMQKKMDRLVGGLTGLLAQRNETRLAVGEFFGARALNASTGPAIGRALEEALARKRVEIDDQASLEIRGEYFLNESPASGPAALKIKLQVVDTNAGRAEVARPEIDLFDAATVARLTGVTGDLSGSSNRERLDKVRKQVKSPDVDIRRPDAGGSVASRISAPGQPYAVEILVKAGADFEPRAGTSERGRAFVSLRRGEVYAVRLINDSPLDAAVELCVDGVNILSLHDDPGTREARIIIPGGRSKLVRGYIISDAESKEFLLVGIGEAVDPRLPSPGSARIGTISALFSAAWPEGDAPPRDEPESPITEGADDNRTIPGVAFASKIERVRVEIGKPRAQISIRYNQPSP